MPPPPPRSGPSLERVFGGSPLIVVLKLAVISLLVGYGLSELGLTPWDLFIWVQSALSRLVRNFGAVMGDAGRWLLFGAMIVIPVWILIRLLRRR